MSTDIEKTNLRFLFLEKGLRMRKTGGFQGVYIDRNVSREKYR